MKGSGYGPRDQYGRPSWGHISLPGAHAVTPSAKSGRCLGPYRDLWRWSSRRKASTAKHHQAQGPNLLTDMNAVLFNNPEVNKTFFSPTCRVGTVG